MRHNHGFATDQTVLKQSWSRPQLTSGLLTAAEVAEARQGPGAVAALVSRLRKESRV